ncbi:MAG: hypothetical protein K6G52_08815 [Treponemataceae bacterium]|nr:hypothetical protein [Treponemataceae bacterium]
MQIDNSFLEKIAQRVKTISGLCLFGAHKDILRHYLEDRLSKMNMNEMEFWNFLDNEQEMRSLINSITIGETYFFREEKHFDFLDTKVFPKLKPNSLVWSAACATGEEAISLAVLNCKHGSKAKIIASDINTNSLAKFEKGIYRPRSFRQDGIKFKKELDNFSSINHDSSTVFDKNFISTIHKADFNLIKRCGSLKNITDGSVSVILARNVLIYFDHDTQREVVNFLIKKLEAGGILLLSTTEISHFQDFEVQGAEKLNFNNVFYFQKTEVC